MDRRLWVVRSVIAQKRLEYRKMGDLVPMIPPRVHAAKYLGEYKSILPKGSFLSVAAVISTDLLITRLVGSRRGQWLSRSFN